MEYSYLSEHNRPYNKPCKKHPYFPACPWAQQLNSGKNMRATRGKFLVQKA